MLTSKWHDKLVVLGVAVLAIGLCQWLAQIGQGLAQHAEPAGVNNGRPMNVHVIGNTLVVMSEDTEALKRVAELVRGLGNNPAPGNPGPVSPAPAGPARAGPAPAGPAPAGPGDSQVIALKYAKAVDVARFLAEHFNGPGGSRNPGGNRGGEYRIRVLADPTANSVTVKASPMDLSTIHGLIEKQLDVEVIDASATVVQHPPIRLNNIPVAEASSMVRDLLRETKDNSARDGGLDGGFASMYEGTNRTILNIDPSGNPRGVIFTMTYDTNTNSLSVVCPTPMYEDLKALIQHIDVVAAHRQPVSLFFQRSGSSPSMRFKIVVRDEGFTRPVVFGAGKLPKDLPSWFTSLDANNDGQVALHEWRKGGKDIAKFREWDRNDDGYITAEEAFYKQRQIMKFQGTGDFNAFLGPDETRDSVRNTPCHIYPVRMTQGRTYVIDLRSRQFDSFLRLEDSSSRQLAQDDDSGGHHDARISFRCQRSGVYRVIATSVGPNARGAYTLSIREK